MARHQGQPLPNSRDRPESFLEHELEARLPSVEPSGESSASANTVLAACERLKQKVWLAVPEFLTHRNRKRITMCCFELLSLEIFCCAGSDC